HFPQSPTSRYDLAPVRTQGQRDLQFRILIVIHQLRDQPSKRRRLNKFHTQHHTPLAYILSIPLFFLTSNTSRCATSNARLEEQGSEESFSTTIARTTK